MSRDVRPHLPDFKNIYNSITNDLKPMVNRTHYDWSFKFSQITSKILLPLNSGKSVSRDIKLRLLDL